MDYDPPETETCELCGEMLGSTDRLAALEREKAEWEAQLKATEENEARLADANMPLLVRAKQAEAERDALRAANAETRRLVEDEIGKLERSAENPRKALGEE